MDDSSDLISSDAQVTKQSTSPNWVKIPGDKGQDFSADSKYSAQKIINGKVGGVIKLNVKIDWEIKGFDVSDINPNTFNFFYVGELNEMVETSKEELTVDYKKHKLIVKGAIINSTSTGNTPEGICYGFTR